jgi:hypothetical protein
MRSFHLFDLFGIAVRITPVGVGAFLLAAAALAWLATSQSGLSFSEGWLAGLFGALLMFAGEWLHQLGHALAARLTGHRMLGMEFFSVFARSLYPTNEPPLPADVHIRRALGGFWVSLLLGMALVPATLAAGRGPLAWALGFAAFYNFVVLGLGALIPPISIAGVFENDGGTIWRVWRSRK